MLSCWLTDGAVKAPFFSYGAELVAQLAHKRGDIRWYPVIDGQGMTLFIGSERLLGGQLAIEHGEIRFGDLACLS